MSSPERFRDVFITFAGALRFPAMFDALSGAVFWEYGRGLDVDSSGNVIDCCSISTLGSEPSCSSISRSG